MSEEQMKIAVEEFKDYIASRCEGYGVFVLLTDATGKSCWSTNMLHTLKFALEATLDNIPKLVRPQ